MKADFLHRSGWSNAFRLLPDFFILGAQKSGTTSLHHYLIQHPHVRMPMIKEVHFFDENFSNGVGWYRKHFPTFLPKLKAQLIEKSHFLYGESTPYYLFHPLVPKRISKLCPNARFIILLKDPVDRAYSHYQHERKRGFEALPSFEAAIEAEPARLAKEKEKLMVNGTYNSFEYMHYSYLSRGHYDEQIEQWFKIFPKDRFLILEAEDFRRNTLTVFRNVLDFLEINDFKEISFREHNTNSYEPMAAETRKSLSLYFEPHNKHLYKLLGTHFNWC